MAKVSVVIPCYNGERWLAECLWSVSRQSFQDWEVLIIDDGSSDATRLISERFAAVTKQRVEVLNHPHSENRGLCASRNLAVGRASGLYISLLDADDVWLPKKLSHDVNVLDARRHVDVVFSAVEVFFEDGNAPYVYGFAKPDRELPPPQYAIECIALQAESVPTPSATTVRIEALIDAGGFDERFSSHEDQVFFAHLWLRQTSFVSSACLTRYRRHWETLGAAADAAGNPQQVDLLHFLEWTISETGNQELLELFRDRCERELGTRSPITDHPSRLKKILQQKSNSYF